MRNGIGLFAIVALIVVTGPSALRGQAEETIELRPGFARALRLERSARTVAVGNPEVADAAVQTDRVIVITAKRIGETNLIAIDEDGTDFFHALVLVTGETIVHSTPRVPSHNPLHEPWTYRCTSFGCQRVPDPAEPGATPQVQGETRAQ
jgi:hypothetical protein